jgi:hypothetical protein
LSAKLYSDYNQKYLKQELKNHFPHVIPVAILSGEISMSTEQRNSVRKALKATGQLVLDRAPPLEMQTINVARDGMAITSQEPVLEGAHYQVLFDVTVGGVAYAVTAGAKVVFCVYAGQSEFKSGLRFIELDANSTAAIAGYLVS